jgi:high affinity Mn2+ porin
MLPTFLNAVRRSFGPDTNQPKLREERSARENRHGCGDELEGIPVDRRTFACARLLAAVLISFDGINGGLLADDVQPATDVYVPWSLHTQATWIDQAHPSFDSPYGGPNSFTGDSQAERTFSFSLFIGYRIRSGTELYYDPEAFQGHGLSNTLGMAGFPNGEAVKAAFPNLHYSTSRLYLQQTFGLGGEKEKIGDGPNQIADALDVNRITLSIGKFASSDFFDANTYSHDTRSQFMNWALWESAAWDYPADVVGYTAGFVAEWNTRNWEIHYGIFMEPTESNGARLDYHFLDAHGQILQFDRHYSVGNLTGTFRPFVYWNQAHMGNYQDALENPEIANALTESRAYRSKVGIGISWDQQLTQDLGAFVRLSWDDGRTESFTFTEIDRSLAVGLSMSGNRWNRTDDTFGFAGVLNGIAPSHQAYLEAGGTEGLILGDGGLNYGPEEILETYYSIQVLKWLTISPDFQYAWNPGYNRARGPVTIYAVRAHVEF